MINNRDDLKEYMKEDSRVLGKKLVGVNGRYLYLLRKTEFYLNTECPVRYKIYKGLLSILSVLSGICIPPNTFGKGLGLFHYGSIIVNPTARFSNYCVIQVGVNIAENVRGGTTSTLPLA